MKLFMFVLALVVCASSTLLAQSDAASPETKLIVQNVDAAACAAIQRALPVAGACQQNITVIAYDLAPQHTVVRFDVEYFESNGALVHDVRYVDRDPKGSAVYFKPVSNIRLKSVIATPHAASGPSMSATI